jgi:mannose-6-phosphate isomerase-like protein (cupin superfamily)
MKYALSLLLFLLYMPFWAQPVARISTSELNLGEIAWLMPASTHFKVKNEGNQPLHILEVLTDCGCAKAEWEHDAVLPGQSATISVTYNAELLGTFEKGISVITDANDSIINLCIKGKVVKELVYNTKDFNIHIGDFYLSTDAIDFDNVKRGTTPQVVVKVLNGGSRALHPELMHMPDYLTAIATPDVISPGKVGDITFILNSKLIKDFGLTQSTIYLSRFVGDKISEENALNVSATILPTLPASKKGFQYAPRIELSDTTLVFPEFGKKKKITKTILVKNTGNAPLDIQRLQVYNAGIGVKINATIIQPGEVAKLKVTLHNTERKRGKRSILLITNDPRMPKINIHVEQNKGAR